LAAIAISVALLLAVEKTRIGARESFNNTISKVDLIVGARTGPIQLLLYSVFHMGDATNNISYSSYSKFKNHPNTEWTIPYSLGDSHRGYRVVATDQNFYQHYHYRQEHSVELDQGTSSSGIFDVTLGSEVARKLGYRLDQEITLSHGISEQGGVDHADKPFKVVGILKKTGTPIDRSLFITLEGMEAIHIDWKTGAPPSPGAAIPKDQIQVSQLKPDQITAFLLRTKSRIQSIYLQREINTFTDEPLLAIIPGVTLSQLWQGISYAEDGLKLISIFVVISGLLTMLITLYSSLNERRREMAILRALGASAGQVLGLLLFEAIGITIAGVLGGIGLVYGLLLGLQPWIETQFGIFIPISGMSISEWKLVAAVCIGGGILGFIPALKAYRQSLGDGLTIRI
jgi:putative ABC transport system permease protein